MISQEMKERIIEGLSDPWETNDATIEDPVIFLDNTGSPWVSDVRAVDLFYVDSVNEWNISITNTEEELLHQRHVTVIYVVGEVEEPFKLTREDDPEFIEQCAMAFKMRNL